MAQTLTINLSLVAEFGTFRDQVLPFVTTINLNAQGAALGVQLIGITAEDVTYGDLTAADVGFCFLRNLDATNSIVYGKDNAGTLEALGELLPGEPALFRLKPSEQLMAQAISAPCNLEKRIYRA